MADATIFNATIKAVDQVTPVLKTVSAHLGALGRAAELAAVHARGMGGLMRTAFGEAEEGGHHAAHAAHEAATEHKHAARAMHGTAEAAKHLAAGEHKLGEEAANADRHVARVASHAHAYEVLSGHLNVLRTRFGNLRVGVGEFGHSLSEFLPALGALGAAGSLVGLFELTEHTSEAYSELNKAASAAGMTAESFNALSGAAKLADVPVEQFSRGMFRLGRDIGDALAGKNKDAAALFRQLHISLRDANGQMRSAADLMPQLANAFAHTTSQAMRNRMAMALFGRAGLDMMPMLRLGREELTKLSEEFARASFVPDKEDGEKLEKYHRGLILFQTAVSGLMTEIGAKLAPVLQPIVDGMTDWIIANRDWIATEITDKVREFISAIEGLDFGQMVQSLFDGVKWTVRLIDKFGGLEDVATALGIAIGIDLARRFISWTGEVYQAIKAVAVLGWSITAELIPRLASLGKALFALVAANPEILLVVAAILLVGLAAYEVWRHWAWFKQKWHDFWSGFGRIVSRMLDDMGKALVALFKALGTGILAAVEWVVHKIEALVDRIIKAVKKAFDYLKSLNPGAIFPAPKNDWGSWHPGHGNQQGAAPPPPPLIGPHPGAYLPGSLILPRSGPNAPAAAAEVGGVPVTGTVRTEITINGLPPGSTVRSSATGAAAQPDVDVGYSLSGLAGAM